jgi:acyl-CoA thioesterase FadM
MLDGGSEWRYFYPVRPGDRITVVARIENINERTGRLGVMIITTTVTTYTNQLDQVVATQTSNGIRY